MDIKKIISSCSALALIASCSAFAGGIEMPPPPVDFFSGFSVGIIGSFWDTTFEASGSGRIVCDHLLATQTSDDIVAGTAFTVASTGTCVTPGFTADFGAPALGSPLLTLVTNGFELLTSPSSIADAKAEAFARNNGDGQDRSGAVGVQASFGKVFQGATWSYFLGIYGGGQWGEAEDEITSTVNLEAFNLSGSILADLLPNITDDVRIHGRLTTCVEMENVFDVGGQLGVLFGPQTMGYIKGGAAFSDISTSTTISAKFPAFNLGNLGLAANVPLLDLTGTIPTFLGETAVTILDSGVAISSGKTDISGRASTRASDNGKLGFEVGFGLSEALTENVIFSLEYMYRDFGTVDAGPGDKFVPFDLRNVTQRTATGEIDLVVPNGTALPTLITLNTDITIGGVGAAVGATPDPLFYQATSSSVRVHQSVVNAILSYRFGNLFM